jgi:heterodisulfide reductase subunit B
VKTVAYYKGCLASLSAKELDISTQALAPKVGIELIELERVTTRHCSRGSTRTSYRSARPHIRARSTSSTSSGSCRPATATSC